MNLQPNQWFALVLFLYVLGWMIIEIRAIRRWRINVYRIRSLDGTILGIDHIAEITDTHLPFNYAIHTSQELNRLGNPDDLAFGIRSTSLFYLYDHYSSSKKTLPKVPKNFNNNNLDYVYEVIKARLLNNTPPKP